MKIQRQYAKYRESPQIYNLLVSGEAIPVSFSISDVYQIADQDSHGFLRMMPFDGHEPYKDEVSILKWLRGKAPVPEVLQWGVDGGYEYIIVSAMCGDDC